MKSSSPRGGQVPCSLLPALLLVSSCTLTPNVEAPLVDADLSARVGTIESDVTGIKAVVETIKADGSFNVTGNPYVAGVLAAGWVVSNIITLLLPNPFRRKKG